MPHLSRLGELIACQRTNPFTDYNRVDSTKTSLQQRLSARARERWPQLAGVDVRFRGGFAYVTANMPDGESMPLMRLRYGGSAARWGFAVYLASKDGYQDSVLPTGDLAGAPEDALDTACAISPSINPVKAQRPAQRSKFESVVVVAALFAGLFA